MFSKKMNKALSILERLNNERDKEIKKEKLEREEQEKLKLEKNNIQIRNENNKTQLDTIISNPQFYVQLVSFLLFIKKEYPNELKNLKHLLTSSENFENKIMLAYIFLCFGIQIYIISQNVIPLKNNV
tara:strand:- start:148 stop:531 length:384 start_codon:yes stop_codon:yes gene_type:complete